MNKQKFKETEIGKIPKEWKAEKIIEIFNVYGGTTPSTSNDEFWNGEIPWVTPTDITRIKSGIYLNKTEKSITEKAIKECSLDILNNNALLLTTRATIGWIVINKMPVTINQGITALIPKKKDEIYTIFYAYYLQTLKSYLNQLGSGSTFKEISKNSLKNIIIPIVPLEEQKKIAEILSNTDQAIEEVNEAITKTERLKKGLIQELLTKGIGHKEFKETEIGKIPKEWEVAEVKDIGKVFTGKTPSTSKNIYWNGDIPFITPGDMTGYKYVSKSKRYVTLKGANQIGKILPKNTLLIVCIGSTVGKIAVTGKESVTNQQINAIVCNANVDCDYIYYAILFKSLILKNFSGVAAVPIIKKSLFEIFKIPLPKRQAEREKIAEILSTVDKRIKLLKEKKEKLGRVKKGLINDLLTGRKRVKLEA